MVPENK